MIAVMCVHKRQRIESTMDDMLVALFFEFLQPRAGPGHVALFFDGGFFLVGFSDSGERIGNVIKERLAINAAVDTFVLGAANGRDAEQQHEHEDKTDVMLHIGYDAGV